MQKCLLLVCAGLLGAVWAEDAYIQSDGTQHIRTGYCANPRTKVVCDFAYVDATTVQQRIFGADDDGTTAGISFSSYINGNVQYAWAFQDGTGNWTSTGVKADTARRTLTIDGPGNKVTLATGSTVNYTATISTARTKTSIWPLAIFASNRSTGYTSLINPAKAKLYSFAIYEDGAPIHYYKPYHSADGATVGLKDLITGAILTQGAGNAFTCGGDISDNPALDIPGMRQVGDDIEFLVQVDVGTDGTLEITKNGETVSGTSVWATSNDTVVVTATAAEGKRFVQWRGERASFAPGSYLGNASVTLHPICPTTLTALWTAPKTRTWNPTKTTANGSSSYYYWNTPENWLDESGATGMPKIGDTVVFSQKSATAYRVSDDNANNPLYECRFEADATTTWNQGSVALLAGGNGLQYLRKADSGSNWAGLRVVGDGIIPVNIVNNYQFVMQKGVLLGSLSGYSPTPIVVKTGLGSVVNFNQSGNYTYTLPMTRIQEGGWDITMQNTLTDCVISFDGPAEKRLTFCYSSYTTDLKFNGGGICEINDAANHTIEANNKNGRVVFTGTPKFNPMVFSGRFTKGAGLVWSPTGADSVFVCSNGVSDTAGQLQVTKGTVKLVDGASFTALAELAVSDDAVFEVDAASGANFHAEALTLGGTAKLKLASGVTLNVTAASLAGVALAPGEYSSDGSIGRKAAWIEGAGTVVVATGPGNMATWIGGDAASTLVTKDANWQDGTVPDLAAGDLFATFAAGGTEARLAGAAAFDGLALNNTAGTSFTFAAEPSAQATIAGNGIAVVDASAATTWTMGWPVALGADQTWTVGAGNTFRLTGTLSGANKLTIDNSGTVELAAPSAQTGALELKGGTMRVTASNAFGPVGRTVNFHHLLTKYVFVGDLTFDAPMYSGDQCESWDTFMTVEAGSHLTFNGNFGYLAEGGITFGAGSVTVFKGGVKFNTDGMKGKIVPRGSGTMVVSNANISTCRSWEGQAGNPVTLDLCVANNALNDASYWAKFQAGRLLTHAAKATKSDAYLYFDDATWDLCGKDQQTGLLAATAKAKIVSDAPATLTVNSNSSGDGQNGNYGGDARVNRAVFSGQVSLKKNGSRPHALGAESSTTGSVEVAAGTLTFNASGKWPNATGVKLSGGALVLQNSEAVGPNAQWDVKTGTSPVVTLDFSGILPADKLTVDGAHLKGGVYGAVDSGAEHEVAWITGDGLLKVASRGTVLIFK